MVIVIPTRRIRVGKSRLAGKTVSFLFVVAKQKLKRGSAIGVSSYTNTCIVQLD